MKPAVFLLILALALPASAAGEPPVSLTVRTRNWQGYTFETSVGEDGHFVKKFRKDGGPDMKDAPVIAEGSISEKNREHLSKIVEWSGIFSLRDDMLLQDLTGDTLKGRFEGWIAVKRGGVSKTVRFGPNVESIPDPIFAVLDELSRLTQETR